ncbi:SDR family NAD(P)-dependent oxidoreductase [Nocardia yunnanensis]|uniref:SDR family NAD(P)-dependent oxidoreductase n=1 Tax=Nocardia yunnanensis TaxID=2382165 RepID=A0A386ZHK3_9NOCA|nr:nocobactin polyketide synthase NbtC [Nocardia yunnanensis]AYF77017.1 SDR family NAD(P)-dependent oxidoreductase [Nocardia yunnanensis]
MPDYRLPDGSTPIPLSADTPDALAREAAALAAYLEQRPGVSPDEVADMLIRTRGARRHRMVAMVGDHAQLVEALRAVAAGRPHPAVVRADGAAAARRIAYVFPGQGSQRPGMGLLYYRNSPVFRATVDECDAVFRELHGISPLAYLLHEAGEVDEGVAIVQPALFMQMLGLAAMWRAVGVEPDVTVGHSQGEIAAAVVSGVISLADGVRVVTLRANLVASLERANDWTGQWAMAVLGVDRDECEALLARNSGWAELAVVNSAHVLAVSGERPAVAELVATLTAQGKFAKEIRVEYPAHTSFVSTFRADLEGTLRDTLDHPEFLPTAIDCLGATLGEAVTPDLPVAEYWYWNLRNRVRFDLAVAAAAARDVDLFVEIADHPALLLAMQETLSGIAPPRPFHTIGTSRRSARDLREFTRNLAQIAVHHADFTWSALRADDTIRLPLLDFPNTQTNPKKLWAPFDYARQATDPETPAGSGQVRISAPASAATDREPIHAVPQRLREQWIRLEKRKLVPPRTLAILDHTGAATELAAAITQAAARHGASVAAAASDPACDTAVILLPAPTGGAEESAPACLPADLAARVARAAAFVGDRDWLPDLSGIRDVWLATTGGEPVLEGEAPDLVHAAAQAAFRCLASEHPGIAFRHVDLAAGQALPAAAKAVISAVHTAGEPELAARDGKLYAKRLVLDAAESSTVDPASEVADVPFGAEQLAQVVIVGGTGQLGLDLCAEFARRGAGRITLVSRSGGSGEAAARLRSIAESGVAVQVERCDVTDESAVRALAAVLPAPVTLLVHAAVDYAAAAAEPSPETVATAAESKVLAFDRLVRLLPLAPDARVLACSSLSAVIGGRGHAVYAAVNRMLDVAAMRLRANGIAAAAIQWGLWRSVGVDHDEALARISGTGLLPMDPVAAITGGFTAPGNRLVVAAEWPTLRSLFALFGLDPLFAELPDEPPAAIVAAGAPVTAHAAPESAVAMPTPDVAEQVRDALRFVMGMEPDETIDGSMPLVALGLDSLQALDLRKRIESDLRRDLPVTAILGGASLDDVVSLLG